MTMMMTAVDVPCGAAAAAAVAVRTMAKVAGLAIRKDTPRLRVGVGSTQTTATAAGMVTPRDTPRPHAAVGVIRIMVRAAGLVTEKAIAKPPNAAGSIAAPHGEVHLPAVAEMTTMIVAAAVPPARVAHTS